VTTLERRLFAAAAVLTLATGLAYGWMKYLLRGSDPYAVVHHPLQPLMLKLHILVAPVLVFALGVLAVRHIGPQLANGIVAARRSGVLTTAVAAPMVLTGYLIQVLSDERWLRWVGWGHILLGVVFGGAFLAHRLAARRWRGRST
jgi:uncharacterized membrane protein YgdD (TMEM256/DUF423 family)